MHLQWFDLNFDRGLIHVRNTKNGKDRMIPMNATVWLLLEDAKSITNSKSTGEMPKGKSLVPNPCVFPSPRTEKRLVETFPGAVKQAKITDLRFQIFATPERRAWVAAQTLYVGRDLRWSDIRMAMHYRHAMEDAKRRAVEAIAVGEPEPHVKMQRRKFHVTGA